MSFCAWCHATVLYPIGFAADDRARANTMFDVVFGCDTVFAISRFPSRLTISILSALPCSCFALIFQRICKFPPNSESKYEYEYRSNIIDYREKKDKDCRRDRVTEEVVREIVTHVTIGTTTHDDDEDDVRAVEAYVKKY